MEGRTTPSEVHPLPGIKSVQKEQLKCKRKEGRETKPQGSGAHDCSHHILGPGSVAWGQIVSSPNSSSFAAWWKASAFLGIFQVVDSVRSLREQV